MNRRLTLACITLATCVSFAAAAETPTAPMALPSPAEIATKNATARGGLEAWRGVKAMTLTGKMDAGGNERSTLPVSGKRSAVNVPKRPQEQAQLPFVMEFKRPRKMRVELKFEGKTALQVYDGSTGWKLRPYLNRLEVESFTPDELKAAAMQSELDGPLMDYAAKGSKLELEGVEKVAGRDAYKLKLTMKDGQVLHVWVDAQNFLDIKIDGTPRRMDGKLHPVNVYMRDYRNVSGVMVPYVIETSVEGYAPSHKIQIESVQMNPSLPDGLFSKPAVAAK